MASKDTRLTKLESIRVKTCRMNLLISREETTELLNEVAGKGRLKGLKQRKKEGEAEP